MDVSKKNGNLSDIRIVDRSSVEISGIDDILSYDEECIVISLCGVRTVVEGSNLKVTVLSVEEGKISACGRIDAVICDNETKVKKGMFSRLFGGA